MRKKWLLLCSQTVSKPTLPLLSGDEAHAEAEGRQTLKISSCFPNSSSCSFREKLFSPLVCDDSEVFLCLKLCVNFLCFYKGFWEFRAKARSFLIFPWKSLVPCFWRCGILRICGETFWGLCEMVVTVKTIERERGVQSSVTYQFGFQICCFRWMELLMTVNAAQARLFLAYVAGNPHSVCKVILEQETTHFWVYLDPTSLRNLSHAVNLHLHLTDEEHRVAV